MLKAIETTYKGYKFRSRIEARWAYFMDLLGVRYEYEKEGYKLNHGWYLPDFWLIDLDAWLEIKGKSPTMQEICLAEDLSWHTKKIVYLAFGQIPYPVYEFDSEDIESMYAFFPNGGSDTRYYFCECVYCGSIGIQFDGRSDRMPCKTKGCPRSEHGDKGYAFATYTLLDAYKKARQARFEHGVTP